MNTHYNKPSFAPDSYTFARSAGIPEPTKAPITPPAILPAPAPARPAVRGPATNNARPGMTKLVPYAATTSTIAPTFPPIAEPFPAPSAPFVPIFVSLTS